MRTILGFVMAIGLCLVIFLSDVSARGFGGGFGGFRGGDAGFRGAYGGFDRGDRERSFRAGEDYARRRPIYGPVYTSPGFYAGGWGMDESDESGNDGGDDGGDDD